MKKVEGICTLKPHYANEMGISTSSSLLDSISFMLFLTDIWGSKYCKNILKNIWFNEQNELALTAVLLFGQFQWLFCKLLNDHKFSWLFIQATSSLQHG